MRVACLFSGGKDSAYAVFWALSQGFEPVLLTAKPEPYSMMFHHPNIEYTKLQAEAMGLEQEIIEVTEDNWEEKITESLKKMKAEGIVAGAIASEYQRRRFEKIAESLNIPSYAPLWHKGKEILNEMLENMDIRIVAVAAEGLGKEWLGKSLKELVENTPKHVDAFLEGGGRGNIRCRCTFLQKKNRNRRMGYRMGRSKGSCKNKECETER